MGKLIEVFRRPSGIQRKLAKVSNLMGEPILRVAVACPVFALFDYLPPLQAQPLLPGQRLQVPFKNRQRIGILIEVSDHSELDRTQLRRVSAVLEHRPAVSANLLRLAQWCANYYHYPLGEVLDCMLPAALRRVQRRQQQGNSWRLTAAGYQLDKHRLSRAPAQFRVWQKLLTRYPEGFQDQELGKGWRDAMRALKTKALVEAYTQLPEVHPPNSTPIPATLTQEQSAVVTEVSANMQAFIAYLLQGITGSGKTEVYLALAEMIIAQNKQVLILVPEISLLPQLAQRTAQRLAARVAVVHSSLSRAQRLLLWQQIDAGEIDLVIGTRSALFSPLHKLGLIVVDEEHDRAFKQQLGWRYHARDVALVRAQQAGIPILLGSATPSLETLNNALIGRYRRLELQQRPAGAAMPTLQLVDLRGQSLQGGLAPISRQQIHHVLQHNRQALLYINRRGFAPTLVCHQCGWSAECRRCDAQYVVHKAAAKLRCHHCAHEQALPNSCAQCGSSELLALGEGTERIEQHVKSFFPGYPVFRIDRDTMGNSAQLSAGFEKIRSSGAAILVGTQMLAKGHDFPRLALVVVVDADRGLYSADFRASEHSAQLVHQVAGRAGRTDSAGQVLLQTYQPDNELLQSLVRHGYARFAEFALRQRQTADLPPFTRLAILRAEAKQQQLALQFLRQLKQQLLELQIPLEVLGPTPPPMERLAGRYRAQLLLQSPSLPPLHRGLRYLRLALERNRVRAIRWSLDVDPVDMF